jgi:hypothetical protein
MVVAGIDVGAEVHHVAVLNVSEFRSRQTSSSFGPLNPRCSIVVDMDDRPLMGMRSNMAKAVMITGDAEMEVVGSGKKITIGAGPWCGEYLPEQAAGLITSRYLLQARDGAVGTTGESFREMISSTAARDSQIVNDNMGRVFIKIRPKRIRAWDFSKAPIGWMH